MFLMTVARAKVSPKFVLNCIDSSKIYSISLKILSEGFNEHNEFNVI